MKAGILVATTILFSVIGCATLLEKRLQPTARLNQYGVFSPTVEPGVPTDTIFKDIDYVSNPKLLTLTTRIPCRLGTRFGVLFDLDGLPEDGITKTLTVRWDFPEMLSPTGRKVTSSTFTSPIGATKENWKDLYFDWGLEEDFELVSGNWTISVYYEDMMMLQQVFVVEGCKQETKKP